MRQNPDNAPHKKAEYKAKLEAMNERDLFLTTKNLIWFSALCYDEWQRRKKGERYAEAWQLVYNENCGG